MSRRGAVVLAIPILLWLAGCSGIPSLATAPAATGPTGWVITTSDRQDLRLVLPPWLEVFETSGAVFANEVRPDRVEGLQLMAEGPQTAHPQPAPGDDVRLWLERKVGAPGQGDPVLTSIELPAGSAIVLERVDRPGTARARRITAYAIETAYGVAFLLIDGPLDSWAAHEEDARLIPLLLAVAPADGVRGAPL